MSIHPRGLYAILDHLTNDLVGGIHIHRHQAAAVRFFTDVANMTNSQIALHPGDYALVCIAFLREDSTPIELVPEFRIVLEGATWAAAQNPTVAE